MSPAESMTIEERVLTALQCRQPDRVPVFTFIDPYTETHFLQDPSYADVLEACVDYADVAHNWFFPAGIFCSDAQVPEESRQLPDGRTEHIYHTPKGPLTSITRADWRGSGTLKRQISEPEDVERYLSVPYVPQRPDVSGFFRDRETLAGKCVTQLVFEDPICIAGYVDEMQMAVWTLEHRDLIIELLEARCERILDQLRYCLEHGMGPLYYFNGPEYALPPLMSPADFEEFVVQYDSRLIKLVHSYPGTYTIIHSHGRVSRFLESFAGMGTDGLNVLEPPPIGDTILADAKMRIGDRVCLIGNIQYDDLARGSEEQVERLVKDAIEQGATGGGFILAPCAKPYESPLPPKASRNLVHYLRMAHQYGRY